MCSLLLGAAALSAYSSYKQSEANNRAQEYNAAVAETNAKTADIQGQDAQRRGEQEAIAQGRKTAALRGQQRATLAARGLDLSYGSSAALIDQTDYFGQVDTNTIRDNADKETWARSVDANNLRAQASFARGSKTDSLMAAGTSFLTTYAVGVDNKWMPASKTPPTGGASPWDLTSGRDMGGLGMKGKW